MCLQLGEVRKVARDETKMVRGQLLEVWLVLTICLEVSKPIRFYGS